MKFKSIVAVLVLLVTAGASSANDVHPKETRNAALRYWMAFAEMRDQTVDKRTQELLEKTVAGDADWDAAKLSPILDANLPAIEMMQRATSLPECDWGIEYGRGASASISYAPRARALARLNTLQGMRQLAGGYPQAAITTWMAGIRFSQDIARGGSLIFLLIAKSTFLPSLHALALAARDGKLNDVQKREVLRIIKSIPESAFDWSAAWGLESSTMQQTLRELQASTDPAAAYRSISGESAPPKTLPPSNVEIDSYRRYMLAVQSALAEPPARANVLLKQLSTEKFGLGELERNLIPSPQKVNDARAEIANARSELIRSLSAK